jgi:hypothetical protein
MAIAPPNEAGQKEGPEHASRSQPGENDRAELLGEILRGARLRREARHALIERDERGDDADRGRRGP